MCHVMIKWIVDKESNLLSLQMPCVLYQDVLSSVQLLPINILFDRLGVAAAWRWNTVKSIVLKGRVDTFKNNVMHFSFQFPVYLEEVPMLV